MVEFCTFASSFETCSTTSRKASDKSADSGRHDEMGGTDPDKDPNCRNSTLFLVVLTARALDSREEACESLLKGGTTGDVVGLLGR